VVSSFFSGKNREVLVRNSSFIAHRLHILSRTPLDICIFFFADEGNSSGRNVHNHIFSQRQLFNSFFLIKFLTYLATHRTFLIADISTCIYQTSAYWFYPASRSFLSRRFFFVVFLRLSLPLLFSSTVRKHLPRYDSFPC